MVCLVANDVLVRVEWIRDLRALPLRGQYGDFCLPRDDIRQRGVQCPVPVRDSEPCSRSLEPLLQAGIGVFIGDRGDMLMEGLLVQSDVRPVPGGENDRTVSAVATKVTFGAYTIKGSVWSAMNPGDLKVGLGILLINRLETSKSP